MQRWWASGSGSGACMHISPDTALLQLPDVKERLETAVIVLQRCFCGGPVDLSVGMYTCLMDHRKQGFAQYTWNAEKALGGFPRETRGVASLYCTAYAASAYYAMLTNKHGMYSMELSTLCRGLCRCVCVLRMPHHWSALPFDPCGCLPHNRWIESTLCRGLCRCFCVFYMLHHLSDQTGA